MYNECLFFTSIIIITFVILLILKIEKEALVAVFCLQNILANLFIPKQICLFSFYVTASDMFTVGGIFTLNLIQEYSGKKAAYKAIIVNLCLLLFYLCMTQFHLAYSPNQFDSTHNHYVAILHNTFRIVIASIISYFVTQISEIIVFQFITAIFRNLFFSLRSFFSSSCTQLLDTILFSFLGLYGTVASLSHIILVSFVIKITTISVISLCTPLIKNLLKQKY